MEKRAYVLVAFAVAITATCASPVFGNTPAPMPDWSDHVAATKRTISQDKRELAAVNSFMKDYLSDVNARICKQWKSVPNKSAATVFANIKSDGSIEDVSSSPPGSAALGAVEVAAPFKHLIYGSPRAIRVRIDFSARRPAPTIRVIAFAS